MKRLPIILLLALASCTSEEPDLFSFLEENPSQTRNKEENDSTASSGISFILEPDEFEEEIEEVNL